MSYKVVWTKRAEDELTRLWLGLRMRHAITRAADFIDAELEQYPHDCGESRDGGKRVMFVWPPAASFEIDESQQQVRVISIWRI